MSCVASCRCESQERPTGCPDLRLQEFDFNTGGLSLTAGQQHVAFLSTSALAPRNSAFHMPTAFVANLTASSAVPETGSIALLGLGVLGVAAQRRRRSK